jgi:hypothetical protein
MVDGSATLGDWNTTATTTSSSNNNNNNNNNSSSSIIENVAELQFGPDFEDIHST